MAVTEVKVFLTCPGRNYTLVKIMTDQGVYGIGDGTLNGSEAVVAQMIRHMSELIIGHDEDRIADIWQLLYHWGYWRNGPIFKVALGAIDVALWDIKGKKAGMPVYQLLGGRARDGAMVYGHAHGKDHAAVEDSVRSFMERGYKVIRAQPPTAAPACSTGSRHAAPACPPQTSLSRLPRCSRCPRSLRSCAASWAWSWNCCTTFTSSLPPTRPPGWRRSWSLFGSSSWKTRCGPNTRRGSG
jgi:mannonate dehydratase